MLNNNKLIDKVKSFTKKHKKLTVVASILCLVLIVSSINSLFKSDSSSDYTPPEDKYPRVDVNGLSINEACEKLREKGWTISSVSGHSSDYESSKDSDCSDTENTVSDVSYYGGDASLSFTFEKIKESTEGQSTNTESVTPAEEADSYTDALRKCTVMEAFDIHTTGIGGKTNNAFNDGRETCEQMFRDVYKNDEKTFISDVSIDWESRKNEQIDGEAMPYYLGILGW